MGKLYGTRKHGVMAHNGETPDKDETPLIHTVTLTSEQATAKKVTISGVTACTYPLATSSDGSVRAVSSVKFTDDGVEITLGTAATGDVVTVFGI